MGGTATPPNTPDMSSLPGQQPSDQGQPQQSGEEMKAQLESMFSELEDEYRKLTSSKFSLDNSAEQSRIAALRQILGVLQNMGIDPNNQDQVKAFLDQLQQQDPDLLAIFDKAMNGLLGQQPTDLNKVPEGQAPPGVVGDANPLGMPSGSISPSQLSGMAPAGTPPPGIQPSPTTPLSLSHQGGKPQPPLPQSPSWQFPNLMKR